MNDTKFTRLNKPDFDRLYEMKSAMRKILEEEADFKNTKWMEKLDEILEFQDADGSFKLLSSNKIPSDARVDFCHEPTYICTSILMKTYLAGDDEIREKLECPIFHGLEMSTSRNLNGHGYEALQGKIEALNIFMKGGLREFIDLYGEMNSKFTDMILKIKKEFESFEEDENFKGEWGEDYSKEILEVNKYFNTRKVFVYGTLMKGEGNHHFLEDSKLLGASSVEGYDMYNVGWFPAIVRGDSRILGELYEVSQEDMPSIDALEGEGSLYRRRCEITKDNEIAYLYEYLDDISGLERINSWRDYIWYVSYGSNMLYERFLTYIEGGAFEDGGSYNFPCNNTSEPVERRTIEIPHDMYFGNHSGSWNGCGVSFLDISRKGHALGVAYLITREQFEHVAAEENGGRFPDGYGNWYEDINTLGEMDGFEMVTITNNELRPYEKPCEEYLNTLKRGIRQNWSEMSEEEIDSYLESCDRTNANSASTSSSIDDDEEDKDCE